MPTESSDHELEFMRVVSHPDSALFFEIGPDRDGLDLVEVRLKHKAEGREGERISFPDDAARMVADGIDRVMAAAEEPHENGGWQADLVSEVWHNRMGHHTVIRHRGTSVQILGIDHQGKAEATLCVPSHAALMLAKGLRDAAQDMQMKRAGDEQN